MYIKKYFNKIKYCYVKRIYHKSEKNKRFDWLREGL